MGVGGGSNLVKLYFRGRPPLGLLFFTSEILELFSNKNSVLIIRELRITLAFDRAVESKPDNAQTVEYKHSPHRTQHIVDNAHYLHWRDQSLTSVFEAAVQCIDCQIQCIS